MAVIESLPGLSGRVFSSLTDHFSPRRNEDLRPGLRREDAVTLEKIKSELLPAIPLSTELTPDSIEFSESKLVNDYVYFLASTGPDGRPVLAEDFQRRVSEIMQEASIVRTESPGPDSSADIELSMSAEAAVSLTYSASRDRAFVSANYSLSAEAHLHASFQGADGSTVEVDANIEIDVSASVIVQRQNFSQQAADPLALDLDGDGSVTLSSPRIFDVNADGAMDRVSFASGADVFLALDRNGNGRIDHGGELFGDQHGAINGFAELARFDADQNGVIDAHDPVFAELTAVKAGLDRFEQFSLAELGVSSIGLGYTEENSPLGAGNSVAQRGYFTYANGQTGTAFDILLARESASSLGQVKAI